MGYTFFLCAERIFDSHVALKQSAELEWPVYFLWREKRIYAGLCCTMGE